MYIHVNRVLCLLFVDPKALRIGVVVVYQVDGIRMDILLTYDSDVVEFEQRMAVVMSY